MGVQVGQQLDPWKIPKEPHIDSLCQLNPSWSVSLCSEVLRYALGFGPYVAPHRCFADAGSYSDGWDMLLPCNLYCMLNSNKDCQLYRENHEKIELCPVAIYFRPGMILLSCFRPRQKLSLETLESLALQLPAPKGKRSSFETVLPKRSVIQFPFSGSRIICTSPRPGCWRGADGRWRCFSFGRRT